MARISADISVLVFVYCPVSASAPKIQYQSGSQRTIAVYPEESQFESIPLGRGNGRGQLVNNATHNAGPFLFQTISPLS